MKYRNTAPGDGKKMVEKNLLNYSTGKGKSIEDVVLLRYDGEKEDGDAGMFVVVWQFEIAEDKVAGFEAAYGPEGAWAQLFRSSPDCLGTELLRDAYVPGSYLTIDRWKSEAAFRDFRREHDADYEKIDRECDALTAKETRIGAYTA